MKSDAHIHYTLLNPATTLAHIGQLCKEAADKNVAAVSVPPLFVNKAKALLAHTTVKVSTVIGYPYGYNIIEAKLAEIIMAMVDGCDEMEVYINLTALKNADWQYLARELSSIAPVVQKKEKVFTVVINNAMLTNNELIKCCDLYGVAGINFFSLANKRGADAIQQQRIKMLRTHLADTVKIKIAGQQGTEEELAEMIQAGADIISLPFTVK